MIPRPIVRALEKLVRDRDRWKRRALDRRTSRGAKKERAAQIDKAAERILFMLAIEGVNGLSRGGRSCVWDALRALRPDAAKVAEEEDPATALRRFFPDPEDVNG